MTIFAQANFSYKQKPIQLQAEWTTGYDHVQEL